MTDHPLSEERFTAPTKLCSHPERWHSRDVDSTEYEVAEMVYGLVRGLQPELCLETGTGFGVVAIQIAGALVENGHGRLVTIEADEARVDGCRALWELDEPVTTIVHGDSRSWTPDGVIDFAWFDSYYQLRVPEFLHYRPHMRKGTIVCFHDTAPGHGAKGLATPDIRATIARNHVVARDLRLIHLPTPRGLTIGEVR